MQTHTYTIMRVHKVQCLYELLFRYDLIAFGFPDFGIFNQLVIGAVRAAAPSFLFLPRFLPCFMATMLLVPTRATPTTT